MSRLTRSVRALFGGRYWWLLPLLLLLVPAALVLFFLWNTPDFATFEYRIF
jgi:hypothetical protein